MVAQPFLNRLSGLCLLIVASQSSFWYSSKIGIHAECFLSECEKGRAEDGLDFLGKGFGCERILRVLDISGVLVSSAMSLIDLISLASSSLATRWVKVVLIKVNVFLLENVHG